MAGIGCAYCAWCFDESLFLLQSGWEADARERAELEAQAARDAAAMRRG